MNLGYKSNIEIIQSIPQNIQKKIDIQVTQPSLIHRIIKFIKNIDFEPKTIIEPGCGTGEFIYALQEYFPYSEIVGIEKNETLANSIQNVSQNVSIEHKNFLRVKRKFDLIIGWPPSCILKKEEVLVNQKAIIEGRPNSFVLFLLHAMEIVEQNGIIAFILPRLFLSALTFNIVRDMIHNNYEILGIFYPNDKQQKHNFVFIIRKNKNNVQNHLYSCTIRNCIVFNEPNNIASLKELVTSHNLYSLQMDVKIGTILWNKHKDCLTNDPTKTKMIYYNQFGKNGFVESDNKNPEKKGFIDKEGIREPVIIVKRGDTKGFNVVLLDDDYPFLIEQHLMYIFCIQPLSRKEKRDKLNLVYNSLINSRTRMFIDLYFGINPMNASELKYILPLYI